MSDRGRIRRLALLLAILLSGCNRGMANTNNELGAASTLFERFETVFYAKGDLLSGSDAYHQLSKQDADALRTPFGYLLGGLDSLGKRTSAEIVESGEAVLVGAKDFRPPAGLGGVRSGLCYVVVLRSRSAFDLGKYFRQAPVAFAVGTPVWNWSARLGEFGEGDPRPSSLYATQVAHSYLLVSNDLQELQTIAGRLASADEDRRMLTRIRDWEFVSQHRVWGYRRYRHSGVVDRVAAGMSDVTPGAEALIFFVDLKKKAGVLRLLSSPVDEGTAAKINARAVLPRLKPRGVGVWETIIPLVGDEESFEQMFGIMGLFGFGIYL